MAARRRPRVKRGSAITIPNLYDASSSKTTTSRVASEESPSSSGRSSMMKQALLKPEDKIAIEELYKNLNPINMWILSTGTIVEKKGTICSSLHLRTVSIGFFFFSLF